MLKGLNPMVLFISLGILRTRKKGTNTIRELFILIENYYNKGTKVKSQAVIKVPHANSDIPHRLASLFRLALSYIYNSLPPIWYLYLGTRSEI